MFTLLILLIIKAHMVFANTEKVIFLGPSSLQVSVQSPTLEDLQLESLSPQLPSVRTHIRAEFPTDTSKYGESTWVLLHSLHEGQRYEVRICWAATQPTSFRLDTYELPIVFETPELIKSLAQYSQSQQSSRIEAEDQLPSVSQKPKTRHTYGDACSTLFLHIQAAADYYTMNRTLMEQVPPVYVDVILDPYVLNVLPRSLVPTVGYIIILAIGSWYLSKYVNRWVGVLGQDNPGFQKKTA